MTITIDSMAHGGDGVGRRDGKAIFVAGAIPGDVVTTTPVDVRKRFEKATIDAVVEASPDRVTPVCQHFSVCGGCQWQMAAYGAQLDWKGEIVRSQLAHLGKLETEFRATVAPSPPVAYRNRMDFRLIGGRPALNRAQSHDPVLIDECHLLVTPLAMAFARLGPIEGERLTLRHGVNTGETLVLVDDDDGVLHEVVAGHRFQITRRAFFQVNTGGAEHLVAVVGDMLGVTGDDTVVDAYAGGGLFAATVGREAAHVVAIESDPTAVGDLRVNAPSASVIEEKVEVGLGGLGRADVVVVDPPRNGLGRNVVDALAGIHPRKVAYVSCDPASFARDARLLVDAGFELREVHPVDMFPQTYHVELVAAFERF